LPIIIYNIPGRSVVDMTVETMARLAKLPRIAGVKDATNDLGRALLTRLACGPKFAMLSGEDPTVVAFLAQGGHGIISVCSNIAPRLNARMQEAWQKGDLKTVGELRDRLMPVSMALFAETSPGPVKYAASLQGHCTDEVRLPLVKPGEAAQTRMRQAMVAAGLLGEGRSQAAE
jgi:4-hydroxy-tetrahydrodipicolinate synthase